MNKKFERHSYLFGDILSELHMTVGLASQCPQCKILFLNTLAAAYYLFGDILSELHITVGLASQSQLVVRH